MAENEEMNAPLEEEQEKAPAQKKKETAKKPNLFTRFLTKPKFMFDTSTRLHNLSNP